MATYNVYLRYSNSISVARDIIEQVYGVNFVQVVDTHDFMPTYIQFTSTLLSDEGVNEHIVKQLIWSGIHPSTFVIMRILCTREVLI